MSDQTLERPDVPPPGGAPPNPPGDSNGPRRRRSRPIALPVILIGLGAVLLLQNLGVVDAGVWDVVWRLWPLALIAVGLELVLGRRSYAVGIAIATVAVVVIVGALAFGWGVGGTSTHTEEVAIPVAGAGRAEIELDSGVGGLELRAGADEGELVSGTAVVPDDRELVVDREDDDGTAVVELRVDGSGFPFRFQRGSDGPAWDLELARGLPLDLRFDTGVGASSLDLTGLDVERLDIDAGVGETTVTLPSSGRIVATIDGGVGEITVRIPSGMAARIRVDTGIGDADVVGPWARDGDVWVSEGWDAATDRVDLAVSTGVGQVTIEPAPAR